MVKSYEATASLNYSLKYKKLFSRDSQIFESKHCSKNSKLSSSSNELFLSVTIFYSIMLKLEFQYLNGLVTDS